MQKTNYSLYMHENKINNKRYIGITCQKNVNKRWQNGNGYKTNKYFYRAIQKYGWDNFEHCILFENKTKKEALKYEILLIEALNTTNPLVGYNITKGGEGITGYRHTDETKAKMSKSHMGMPSSLIGYRHTDEAKAKMSKAHKGRVMSEDQKKKISLANTGKIRSVETRKKLSDYAKSRYSGEGNPMYGKKHTKEARQKISRANKGKRLSEFEIQKRIDSSTTKRAVKQYDIDGNLMCQYDSISDAHRKTNSHISGITLSCQGKIYTSNGFVWRYFEDHFDKYKAQEVNKVVQFDKDGCVINVFNSIKDAATYYGVDYSLINKCCRGICKTAKGYIWQYVDKCKKNSDGVYVLSI